MTAANFTSKLSFPTFPRYIFFILGLFLLIFFLSAPKTSFAAIAFRSSSSAFSSAAGSTAITTALGAYTESTDNNPPCEDVNPSIPAGNVGDLLITQIVAREENETVAMPGWNLLFSDNIAGADYQTFLFWRSATGGDPNTITQANACDHLMARITRFGNVDPVQPLETQPLPTTNWNYSNTDNVDTGTQDITIANSMLILASFVTDNRTLAEDPSFTELYDHADSSRRDAGISLNYRIEATTGTKGPFNNMALQGNGNDPNHGVLFAIRPSSSGSGLTIPTPASTTLNDTMIASIAYRPCSNVSGGGCTTTITPPAGWTLIRGIDTSTGGGTGGFGSRLFIYRRLATATEPAAYTWNLGGIPTHAGATGSILCFTGVDLLNPIVAEAGQPTPNSYNHPTPSINTGTETNTMLVSSHSVNSSGTWTPPAGMTERVDIASMPVPDALGIMLETNYQLQVAAGPTGIKTAIQSNPPASDTGGTHLLALRPGDTIPPITPTVVSQTTNDPTPIITGTFDSTDYAGGFTVTVNSVTYTLGTNPELTNIGNNWTLNLSAIAPLADGTYQVIATATDGAGNSATDLTSDELIIDQTAPTIPTVVSQTTNDPTPLITGTFDSTDYAGGFTVTVNGVTYTLGTNPELTNVGNGWVLDLGGIAPLAEAIYQVVATATDGLGNAATDLTSNELIIDLTGPATPTVVSQTTNDPTPIITGTFDSTDYAGGFTVTVNGVTYTLGTDPELTNIGNGWTLNLGAITPLSDGTYQVVAVAMDGAGNASTDLTSNELIIATPPTISGAAAICGAMNEVVIIFSEDVDPITAQTITNYTLDNGITISGATLTATDTVTLTTSALTDLTTYTLTVNNVEDLTGNPIVSGSTSSFIPNCSSLIAFYQFDEAFWDGTANEIVDQSGNGLHGNSVGGVTTAAAKVCNGAILDGITLAYAEVPDNALLDIPDELTVSLWLKTNVIPAGGLKSILSKDENYEFHINTAGQIYWWWNDAGGTAHTLTSAAAIAVDTWHHIAIVYSSSAATQTIYIDGVPDPNSSNRSESLMLNNDPLQVGGDQAFVTREFDGLIDEVRIYERAQTQLEIQADMNVTRPCATLACGFRDNFSSVSYSNNDGMLSWTGNWLETNDDNNPAGGDAYIAGGFLNMNNSGGQLPMLTRELDLTGASAATLEFTFATTGGVIATDAFQVLISGDGGGSWTTMETITGITGATTAARSYPIDPLLISNNTRIRLQISSGFGGANEVRFYYIEVLPVGLCGTAVDHFEISHDGTAINCQAEQITINAHDPTGPPHGTYSTYTGTVTLSTNTGHGDWTMVTGNPAGLTNAGNGNATYTFDGTELGTIVLGLKDTFAETVNIDITDGTASETSGVALPSEDGDLTFSPTGFNFLADSALNAISNQIGGKASNIAPSDQTLELEAIRTSDDTGQCEAALVGNNTIELAFECLDPPVCTANSVNINGTDIAANNNGAVATYTGVVLDFGNNTDTTATFSMVYPDVGQIKLHARYNIPLNDGSATPSGNLMLGSSNNFVVRPFGFDLSATGNPGAVTAADTIFTPAATPFPAKVRAVLWQAADDTDNDGIPDNHTDLDPANNADLTDNPAALNFGQETLAEDVTLTSLLFLPAGGTDPALTGTTTVTGFALGIATSNVSYDEVGIIELIANLTDSNYLSAGNINGRSGHVGRFYPADFEVTIAPDPPTLDDSCLTGIFTYLGQPFNFTVDPVLTITARNTSGITTKNYDCGGFWKLPNPYTLNYSYTDSAAAGPALTPAIGTASPAAGDTTDCGGSMSVTISDTFTYARPAVTAPIQPFAAGIDLAANAAQFTDSDGVCFGLGCQPFNRAGITGANMRHGRSMATNAYGPETANNIDPLLMPVWVEYYDNTPAWTTNLDDSCTLFDFIINTNGTITIDSNPAAPGTVTTAIGLGYLALWPATDPAPPGGTVDLSYDFPIWLDDFTVEAFFGIYRGNDRIINWQEIIR
ncbi:MAG: hypothetical protein KKB30_15205 [Proteobacteria bacterium]|nr:hypothetical protein [Pseudomonadota bacterium]MBU1716272.1 hypothetical protein [Pseudomonadota bacterium]